MGSLTSFVFTKGIKQKRSVLSLKKKQKIINNHYNIYQKGFANQNAREKTRQKSNDLFVKRNANSTFTSFFRRKLI